MGHRAARLAEAVWSKGLQADPWMEARSIAVEAPEEIRPLAELLLERPPGNSVLFHALLSFLPEEEWKPLAQPAVQHLRADPANAVAKSIVRYASLQAAEALADELEPLFSVGSYFRAYDGAYPWRGAGEEAVPFLENVLTRGDGNERLRAFRCLLQMRRTSALAAAMAGSRNLGLDARMLSAHLNQVGFEQRGDAFFRLFDGAPLHVAFPTDYLGSLPPHTLRDLHPSWGERVAGDPVRFGGHGHSDCAVCGRGCHHLISFEPSAAGAAASRLSRLSIDTCLSCLGWTVPVLWFRHDQDGRPSALPCGVRKEPEFPAKPLRDVQVRLVRLGRRWDWQEWGASNSRENLHRIGGHPTWVQSAEYPACPECRNTMRFLLQLDSDLDDGWLWGSGGVLYAFWCDRCAISAQLWQCT